MLASGKAVPAHVPRDRVVEFDIYDPPRKGEDYERGWKELQDSSPDIIWTAANGGHWIATRGAVIREIFDDYRHFSSSVLMAPRERGEIKLLPTAVDPPAHRAYRSLLNRGLSPGAIRLLEAGIRRYTVELVENLRQRGRCEFIEDFARHLPLAVFFQLADLPVGDKDMLGRWMEQVMRPDGSMTQDDAMGRFAAYLSPYIHARRAAPGADLISTIASGSIDRRPISDDESVQMCTALVLGGLDTVIAFMSFTMNFLARSPDSRRHILQKPEQMPAVIEELFRRFPVGTNMRLVNEDYEFHGVLLKGGDLISMPQILHSLDERIYATPLDVDFTRNTAGYSAFGHGVHRCPGSFLAKTEIRVLLEEWLPRIPDFSIDGDAPISVSTGVTSGIFKLPLRWPQHGIDDGRCR
jgi:camphor 5-monooxygenase